MTTQKNLITLCFATVFTLGLAACGGGGGGDAPVTGAAAPTVAELFATAQDSRDASFAAAKAAGDAVKAATEASGKLTTRMVNGDSMTATANAQAVLYMQDATVKAATDAETALQEAKDALEDATKHAADNASLMAALDAAIKAAEADVKTATDDRDGEALKDAVAKVTGANEDEPMSAADHGRMVAMAIGGALLPMSSVDGSGMRVADFVAEPAANAMNVVMMDDHTGKTWAEIVGETSKMRLGTSATETREVDAASIAGMTLNSEQAMTAAEMFENNGLQVGATYKGIPGTAFCQGSDCKVEAVGPDEDNVRKFTGSWYFTPTTPDADNAKVYYEKDGTATDYGPETNYAQFGHWLAVTDDGVVTVHTFAGGGVTGTNTETLDVGTATLLDESATYEGTAAGMSLHKEFDGDGGVVPGTLQSGAFTADVTLTAKFGTAPRLGGYINGFKGYAVDPDWRVTLVENAFDAASLELAAGTTTASGQDGQWSAQGYGTSGARPTGIFGGFNAHFSDGHAAGAYATRK